MSIKGFNVNGVTEQYDYNSLDNKPEIHNVPTGGTAGQVLAKTSGADYAVGWVNQTGGGGGSDIIVDSALSATSENPVQNKVVTTAINAKYAKPAYGIPATDMTSAVQASLAKADTALQTAPVTSVNGQTGDVTIQAATDAQVTTAVNTWLGNNVAQETGYVLDSSLTMSNAAAPADKVGELKSAFDENFRVRTALNNTINLDTYKIAGIYSTTSASLPQNVPENDGGCLIIFTLGNYTKQEYITKKAFYERSIIGATVGVWNKQIVSKSGSTLLQLSDDINNINDTGIYYWITGNAPTNAPISGKFGVMWSIMSSDSMYAQIVVAEKDICYRAKVSGRWLPWTKALGETNQNLQEFVSDMFVHVVGDETIVFSDPNDRQYIDLSVNTAIDIDNPSVASSNAMYAVVPCTPGDVFIINGTGGSNNRLWGFLDSSKYIITRESANVQQTNYGLVAPENAAYFVINTFENNHSSACWKVSSFSDDVVNVDFSENKYYNGTAQQGGSGAIWSGGGQSFDVFVSGAECVYVTANENANSYIVFMKTLGVPTYDNSVTKPIDTSSQSINRITIQAGTTVRTPVPNDAKFMCVMRYGTNKTLYIPDKIEIIFNKGQGKLYRDYVESQFDGYDSDKIMYKKIAQMRDIEWDSKGIVYSNSGSVLATDNEHILTGIPYSSAKEKDKFVGFNVSITSFMTAAHNKYSLLYTEKCSSSGETPAHSGYGISYNGVNTGAYFGQVCNVFAENALGIRIPFNTDEFAYLCKVGVLDKIPEQNANGVTKGDICWIPHHCYVVSDVKIGDDGTLLYVEISEATGAWSATKRMSADEFNSYLLTNGGGVIYRYNEKYKNAYYKPLPFIPLWGENQNQEYEYNDDVCTYAGDYASFYGGHSTDNPQEPIFINCNLGTTSYTTLEVCKVDFAKWKPTSESTWKPTEDDLITTVATYPLSGMGNLHEIMINGTATRDASGNIVSTTVNSPLDSGKYIAKLTGTGIEDSKPTHFEIIDTHVTVTATANADSFDVNFDSSNGRPQYIQTTLLDGSSLGVYELSKSEVEDGKVTYHPKALYDNQYAINYYGAHDGDVIPSGKTYGTNLNQFPTSNGNPDYSSVYCKVFFVGEYGTVRNEIIPFTS